MTPRPASRSSTTGWATAARSRRRSSTSARRVSMTRDPRRAARGRRPAAARRRRVPGGDADAARARARGRAASECARDGMPLFGSCMGMQLLFESSDEHEGATGLGLLRGAVRPLRRRRPEAAAHRLERGALGARVAAAGRPARPGDLLPRALATRPHPADPRTCSASSEYGAPFASVVARDNVFGAQFHPEKSSTHGLAPAAQLRAALPARGRLSPMMRLYPAIDISDGKAVRLDQGRLRRQDRLRRRPAGGGPRVGRRRARATCTSSTSTAPREGRPQNLAPPRAHHRASSACRSSTAAACATSAPCATRCAPAPSA